MHTNLPGRPSRPADHDALPNLKQAGLPPRPRAVLEAILDVASTTLEAGITATLNELEQQLFKLAEQAKSNEQQARCFESLREIRRGRSDVTPRFLIRLEAALASIDKDPQAPGFARMTRGQREEFSLVEEDEFEQSLALQEVASKAEIRNSQPLFALGQRFGVLAGSAAIEADELPVGPHRLCECLSGAAACLDVQLEHRVLLFRVFDRTCMAQLGALYDKLNETCIEHRVLPNLQLTHTRKRGDIQTEKIPAGRGAPQGRPGDGAHGDAGHGAAGGGAAGHAQHGGPGHHGAGGQHGGAHHGAGAGQAGAFGGGASHGAAAMPHAGGHAGHAPAGGGHAGHAPAGGGPMHTLHTGAGGHATHAPTAHGPAGQRGGGVAAAAAGAPAMPDMPDIPGLRGFSNPMTGWPTQAAPPPDHNQPDAREIELFETMRDLLQGRRHALGLPQAAGESGGHQVRGEDVQSVLASLQSKPAPTMMMGGKLVSRSVQHLKQDVLSQLRQVTPDGKQPRLSEMDADTIDLVGMLFDHLSKDVKPDSQVQQLMTRLQIPLLRVALKDKSFFTRRSHPARQLLNSVAESSLFWLDDESDDRALVEKMRVVVDRVSAEYDDGLDIFEDLLGDLSKHLGTISRKSEVAERRHVDAAKGRERLEQARSTASRAIGERIGKNNPPALIKTLLEQAWTDVLALTLLRQGESSEAYRRRLGVADQLLTTPTDLAQSPDDPRNKALKQEVEAGLSQVGYHGEDVQAVVKRLFGGAAAAANDDPTSLTELAIKLKSRSRLGGDAEAEQAKAPKAAKGPPLTAEEQRVLERLRTIPYGTWFEFTINQQGDRARRKLSWFSTLTGRCLFVNQRGVRVEERTLDNLAREVVRGTARVVEAQKESLIDRAWNAIVASLKQFGGKPAAAVAAGAVVKPS